MNRPAHSRPAPAPVKRAGLRLVETLEGLADALAAGPLPPDRYAARSYRVPDPPTFTPAAVRRLRAALGLSQPVFAALVGASVPLVQGWEQGKRVPSPMARRLLQGIAHDPNWWLAMAGPVTQTDRRPTRKRAG